MSESEAAHDQMERVHDAHERLKALRVEYETVSAAGGFFDQKGVQSNSALRARYAEAVEEFFHQ